MGKDNCIGKFTLLDTPQWSKHCNPKYWEKKMILSWVTKIIQPTSPLSASSLLDKHGVWFWPWGTVTLSGSQQQQWPSLWGMSIVFFPRIKDLARAPPMLIRVRGFFRNRRHMITFYGWGVLIIQWGFVSGYRVFIGNHLIFSTCHSKWTE